MTEISPQTTANAPLLCIFNVIYLQWTKRTGKTKSPSRQVHFLLQKNTGNDERQITTSKEAVSLALF